ncbi:MAG TPA: ABC transporter ATP-binding protein [Chloroflexota bacterium]
MMGDLLRVDDVHAGYRTAASDVEVRAVDGVSLFLQEGEVLGVVGESGCGKSTLAAVLALNARPPLVVDDGVMVFDGSEIKLGHGMQLPASWRGKLVSLLPQGAMNSLNPTGRIRDFAVDVIRAHEPGVNKGAAVARAAERLEQLSLPTRALDSYPHQLSGGMKQRVVAAISTLLNPRVLIADEPTSALDVSSQGALAELLLDLLRRKLVGGIVLITHDLPMLSNVANRIAVMYAGRIVETSSTADIVGAPRHPYTRALIGSALVPDQSIRGRRIESIPGAPPDLRFPPSACRFHPRCPLVLDVCSRVDPPQVTHAGGYATCWRVEGAPRPELFELQPEAHEVAVR